jgi:alkylation response protein AidB-like acyl-CoA dehydrogenase
MSSLDYYNIEELLTDEERQARDRARDFVREEVLSEIVPCHRAGKFPEHLIPRMGARGFYAPYLKDHGCAGVSYTAYGLIMQELERADSGVRSLASVQGALAIQANHSLDHRAALGRAVGLVSGERRLLCSQNTATAQIPAALETRAIMIFSEYLRAEREQCRSAMRRLVDESCLQKMTTRPRATVS